MLCHHFFCRRRVQLSMIWTLVLSFLYKKYDLQMFTDFSFWIIYDIFLLTICTLILLVPG